MNKQAVANRLEAGKEIAISAAAEALRLFHARDSLTIETKGAQDWVSEADRNVETMIRDALATHFPDDGIIGEEHAPTTGSSGFTWIIDPIDGTSSFLSAVASWCVVLGCLYEIEVVVGIIIDPITQEVFTASTDQATMVNDKPVHVSQAKSIREGSIAVGHSSRIANRDTLNILDTILSDGGMFYRNGSGAMMLAYVASGRLLAYTEPHMNAWDCLAGMLMIEKAGGQVFPYDTAKMLESGGLVVAAGPGVYDYIVTAANKAYG